MRHHPKKDYKLGLIADFDREYYIDRSYPITFPTIDHVISRNGQQLTIGETTLTFYLAPGTRQTDSLLSSNQQVSGLQAIIYRILNCPIYLIVPKRI